MAPPRAAELWRLILNSRLLDVHTAMPAEVVSFDASAQTVVVQPLIKNVVKAPDGTEIIESYPEIRAVPVLYPRAGGFIIAWPLSAGDAVTVLFNEWSIDQYREKGTEDHPVDLDRHKFSGAVAFPMGPYKASNTISETIDALMIGEDGGAIIRIADDGTIRIASTAGAVQAVALASDVESEITALRNTVNSLVTAYNAHVHTATGCLGNVHASMAGAPAAVGSVGSTKVEVEE